MAEITLYRAWDDHDKVYIDWIDRNGQHKTTTIGIEPGPSRDEPEIHIKHAETAQKITEHGHLWHLEDSGQIHIGTGPDIRLGVSDLVAMLGAAFRHQEGKREE